MLGGTLQLCLAYTTELLVDLTVCDSQVTESLLGQAKREGRKELCHAWDSQNWLIDDGTAVCLTSGTWVHEEEEEEEIHYVHTASKGL